MSITVMQSVAVESSMLLTAIKDRPTYLGSTLYLLNHVAHTSAASSLRPTLSDVTVGVD